ncbi:MAG: RusA family crossover junction endodeoxyribonuclease [Treponema sp.]|nr:RusA family crossover junction endodeoxyribonuclease [Treponema sp.]MCL2245120.1 RusA family crossover junction endodeoxyribonuclease [Treponema sp.]
MTEFYNIFVNGIPKAQPRPRMARNGHVYNPHSADEWKNEIKIAFKSIRKETITKPVILKILFFFPAPKAMKITDDVPHDKKPDKDNLEKAVMDAMTSVGVWKDDALVYDSHSIKYYTRNKTGAQIVVETN